MASSSSDGAGRGRIARIAAVLVALGGLGACRDLPTVTEGICGNEVVEPGETCDTHVAEGLYCGAAGEVGACHYRCTDPSNNTYACQAGAGCGVDGVCRRSGGDFAKPSFVASESAQRMLSGDFDGDGRDDVVAVGDVSTSIHYFETTGQHAFSVAIPGASRVPALGDLNADGYTDLVIRLRDGLGVLRGQSDRTLLADTFASLLYPRPIEQIVPLGRVGDMNEVLLFQSETMMPPQEMTSLHLLQVDGPRVLPSMEMIHEPVEGALQGAVAAYVSQDGCPFLGFETQNPSRLYLYACDPANPGWSNGIFATFSLEGAPWGGAYFGNVDADNKYEIIFGADNGGAKQLYYAKAGSGDPPHPLLGIAPSGTACSEQDLVLHGDPLAVGDLDANGVVDVVDELGVVFLESAQGKGRRTCNEGGRRWRSAAIGNLDLIGFPDLLAARADSPILDVFSGVGNGLFNAFALPTQRPVKSIVFGDFDGDIIGDAALWLQSDTVDAQRKPPGGLSLLFGRPFGSPESPVSIGEIDNVQQVVAGQLTGGNDLSQSDGITDLVVVSSPGVQESSVTLFPGSSARQFLSPLLLRTSQDDMAPPKAPDLVTAGHFTSLTCQGGMTGAGGAGGATGASGQVQAQPASIAVLAEGQLWQARGCKEGELSPVAPTSQASLGTALLLAPLDLVPLQKNEKESATQDLAVFGKDASGKLSIATVHLDMSGNVTSKGSTVVDLPSLSLLEGTTADVPMRVADVDGNGLRDIALTTPRQVIVFWNMGQSFGAKFAVFDLDRYASVDPRKGGVPADQTIKDIAFLHLDDDAPLELVVLTEQKLVRADFQPKTSTFDATDDYTGPEADRLQVRDGRSLLAADVNGDGLADLLIGDNQGVRLELGKEGP
jgi:hypothetical protein